jgi:transcription elongation GreA/GreB family factor
MTIYFSKIGLELKKIQIKTSENKVKAFQKEAADAAGVSYDWHDNFGCEEATRQAETESALLAKLKEEVKNGKLIEPEEQNQKILIGTTVKLLIDGKEREFTIGAYGETNPANGLISYTSPLASSLLDMRAGDSRTVTIGNKETVVAVKEIFPPSYKYSETIEQLLKSANEKEGR